MRLALLFAMAGSLADFKLVRTLDLKGPTHHVQGVDFDERRVWITSVDAPARKGYLHEFLLDTGEATRTVELQNGPRFHPGGIASDGESIWLPVAEYRRQSTSVIERRSKRTLEIEFKFDVPDHIGCIAVTPEFLIGGNWDSREFYVWDHRGRLVRKAANTTGNAYQDIKFEAGGLVASGLLAGRAGAIDWLAWPSLGLTRRVAAGNTSRGDPFTREGMAIRRNRLLLAPEDGPTRLFLFDLGVRGDQR